jgi:hypothetical protein
MACRMRHLATFALCSIVALSTVVPGRAESITFSNPTPIAIPATGDICAGSHIFEASISRADMIAVNAIASDHSLVGICTAPVGSGFWVGLGGDRNSQPVVQAGTQAVLGQDNEVSYSALSQRYPCQCKAIKVPNFEVRPGQRVEFLVTRPHPDRAFISMRNLSTGFATSVGITPTSGTTNDGTSAKWIVEGPGSLLEDFFAALFVQCIRGTKNHDFDLSTAFPREIVSSDGSTVLASGSIIRPNHVVVVWQGSGP